MHSAYKVTICIVALCATLLGVSSTGGLFKASVMAVACATAVATVLGRDVGSAMRLAAVGVLVSFAGFGLAAPWLICRRPPYDGNLCPADRESRMLLQGSRVKWIVVLVVVSIGFAWWDVLHFARAMNRGAKRVWAEAMTPV